MPARAAFRALLLASALAAAGAKSVLVERRGSLRAQVDPTAFQDDLRTAVGEAMGCGGHFGDQELRAIEQALLPTWRALPKNGAGRIGRQSLRYLAHRYFSQRSALVLRGFEPSRPASSSWGGVDILSQTVPGYVESVLESRRAEEHGFGLEDAVRVVATLEQLIFDSDSALLEKVYRAHRKPTSQSLGTEGVSQVLEDYLVHWMMGDDAEGIKALLSNRTFLATAFPHWAQLAAYARGEVAAVDFRRKRAPSDNGRRGHNALAKRFAFEDAHEVVGGITRSFASFWESECSSMKAALLKMDTHGTGRVPLAKFYSSALDTEWRFGESESYLRELGALDESSRWRGKQVMIPNYLQAASNCIVSTPHYMVCCSSECDVMLGELEAAVGAPSAPAGLVLALVRNMTSQTTIDHDDPPSLEGPLTRQLEQLAESHGGLVPLHGRLFAQWLHYAFPRECPFPHRRGTTATLTPLEFGSQYLATGDEMQRHAATANRSAPIEAGQEAKEQWLSQWSAEEELLVEAGDLRAPWEGRHSAVIGGGALVVLALVAALLSLGGRAGGARGGSLLLPTHAKSHLV
mmetsp:Transcript_88314/g.234544  ORF Transcript_88314/g.234544 Transcript_88314/m.234544 type:complete len:576 (-) Transcript_88314:41-1768(-)